MADAHLLSSEKPPLDVDDDDDASSCTASEFSLSYEDTQTEEAKKLAAHFVPRTLLQDRRKQLYIVLACVASLCFLMLVHAVSVPSGPPHGPHRPHRPPKTYRPPKPPLPSDAADSRLPIFHQGHRELDCTTWPDDQVAQLSKKPPSRPTTQPANLTAADARPAWKKPQGFKVVALIFYGRRELVDILDCYLRRNLVSNGGYLDEVQFVANAYDGEDTKWLDELVSTSDEYRRIEVPDRCSKSLSWQACLWDLAADRDTMYLKIDDDVVYIHEDAIPSIVETRLRNKEAFAIGANIVNVRLSAWNHFHNNAIHPYLPEPDADRVQDATITWRPSEMPTYPKKHPKKFSMESLWTYEPPFPGHRWLRLNNSADDLLNTPIMNVERDDFQSKSWPVDAQVQYSLLENLERNQLGKYRIGDSEGIFHPQYRRYNINFVAIWGSDVADNLPFDKGLKKTPVAYDEKVVSVTLPRRLRRPYLVDSGAIVSHFAFHRQALVKKTDLLDRWRAYANENVCEREYKKPWGPRCRGV